MNNQSALPPEQFAREVLYHLQIDIIPTPVIRICEAFDLELHYRDDLDAEGVFVARGDNNHIIIKNSSDSYQARKLFTISHELGHFYLPWHKGDFVCNPMDLNTYVSSNKLESEANRFAAELLMPERFFAKDVRKSDLSVLIKLYQ